MFNNLFTTTTKHKLYAFFLTLTVSLLFTFSFNSYAQSSTSSTKQTSYAANFYLYNPREYTPVITNVSPSLCTYAGYGSVSSKTAFYNNPAEVTSHIIKEPNYKQTLNTKNTIEWSTIYTYKNNLVVIGRYISDNDDISLNSPKSTTTPSIVSPIELNKRDILRADKNSYPEGTILKWKDFSNFGYKNDVTDGLIPIELIDDPIYCSMNFPSESMSPFSSSVYRFNGHTINKLTPTQTTAVGMGAIYLEENSTMSSDFTICLGKIGLYAFSKSQNKWIVIDEQDACKGLHMYELPWTSRRHYACENIIKFDDHVEVKIQKDEINNHAFHFWGLRKPIDQSDYLYYACAYQAWVKEGNAYWRLTTEGGIDAKDSNGNNGIQLISSRGLALTTSPKTCWCHTIPNSEYNHDRDYVQLNALFNR